MGKPSPWLSPCSALASQQSFSSRKKTKDPLIDALRLAPDDAWSYVVLGNIFTREQDWDSAISFFTKALDLKPGDAYALNGLGAASAKSGDEGSAMRYFEAAIVANPHFPEPRFGKALLL